ncbi:MAG: DUF1870 family protein [Candidatus Binataceae bacterium]|jgi:transcriptional regulator with XRE-family HTH domain
MTGKQLRALRRRLKWTQAQMAKAIGVAPNTVARWERGERAIGESIARLVKMIVKEKRR